MAAACLWQLTTRHRAVVGVYLVHISDSFCRRVRSNLDTFDVKEQRMALQALQIKATVTETEVRVEGVLGITDIQPDLATTARTSG